MSVFKKMSRYLFKFVILVQAMLSATVLAHEIEGISTTIALVQSEPDLKGNLPLRFSYKNETDGFLKIALRGTALDGGVFEDILDVSYQGQLLPYIGPVFRRLEPLQQEFVTLAPKEVRSITVNIAQAYDFTNLGQYKINLKYDLLSNDHTSSLLVTVSRVLPKPKRPPAFNACGDVERSTADRVLGIAEIYSIQARNALASVSESERATSPRYLNWFGQYSRSNWERVQANFVKIADGFINKIVTFNCACDADGIDQDTVVAYVYPNRPYEMNICPLFWQFRDTGSNSKAGVLVHEMSHFAVVADTDDHVYGIRGAEVLADSEPAKAITNASSYEYFATNPRNLPINAGDEGNSPPRDDQPDDEEITSGIVSLEPIISLLLEDGKDQVSSLPEATEPELPSLTTRFNAKFELSGKMRGDTGLPAGNLSASAYEYSELNSNHLFSSHSEGRQIYIDLRGGGVVSNDYKTSDNWAFTLSGPPSTGQPVRPGIYQGYANNSEVLPQLTFNKAVRSACNSGAYELHRLRVLDVEHDSEFNLQKLIFDFEFRCTDEDESFFRGAVSYDQNIPVLTEERFDSDESNIFPFIPENEYRGLSMILNEYQGLDRKLTSTSIDTISETRLIANSYYEGRFYLEWITEKYSFQIQFRAPQFNVRTIDGPGDFIGDYPYLPGGQYVSQPVGLMRFIVNGVECSNAISSLKIYSFEVSSYAIKDTVFSFESDCPDADKTYKGAIRLNNTLPQLPYTGPERITGSPYHYVTDPQEPGTTIKISSAPNPVKSYSSENDRVSLEFDTNGGVSLSIGGEPLHFYFRPDYSHLFLGQAKRMEAGSYFFTSGECEESELGCNTFVYNGRRKKEDRGEVIVYDIGYRDGVVPITFHADFKSEPHSEDSTFITLRYLSE
ncbi:MAG: M35 family metallo-endopeptidase [Verrucomicrobiales bacterium]|nr:M35 family metallo-endopeptidase [Verrucomicrobiales bacterium]